jgi:hypothetical protein
MDQLADSRPLLRNISEATHAFEEIPHRMLAYTGVELFRGITQG